MRKYEMMIIYDISEESKENTNSFVKENFEKNNINIINETDFGLRELAYSINEKTKGHYFIFDIESDQKSLPPMEKKIKLNKNILNYIILKQG